MPFMEKVNICRKKDQEIFRENASKPVCYLQMCRVLNESNTGISGCYIWTKQTCLSIS